MGGSPRPFPTQPRFQTLGCLHMLLAPDITCTPQCAIPACLLSVCLFLFLGRDPSKWCPLPSCLDSPAGSWAECWAESGLSSPQRGKTHPQSRKEDMGPEQGVGLAARSQDGKVGTAHLHVLPPHPCCVSTHAQVNTHAPGGLSCHEGGDNPVLQTLRR